MAGLMTGNGTGLRLVQVHGKTVEQNGKIASDIRQSRASFSDHGEVTTEQLTRLNVGDLTWYGEAHGFRYGIDARYAEQVAAGWGEWSMARANTSVHRKSQSTCGWCKSSPISYVALIWRKGKKFRSTRRRQ